MRKEEVELVPAGMVTCFINEKEIRILSISPEIIKLRIANRLEKIDKLMVAFYDFKNNKYNELSINEYKVEIYEESKFYISYTLQISSKEYGALVRKAIKDYYKYITLKVYSEDNDFSKELVDYPSELDYEFYDYYLQQKKEYAENVRYKEFNIELAIKIDNDELYKKYLNMDREAFKLEYLKCNYINEQGMFKNKLSRIYIGNEFCHNLFPNFDILMDVLNKAKKEEIRITICFTYLREELIEESKTLIDKIYRWCIDSNEKVEIVINDYGMLKLLECKNDYFSLNLGVLLNKRKKDPRYLYKKGYEENKELIGDNALNSKIFRAFLKENNIERYEYESCGYKINIAEGKHSLHIPFYVTNLSQYCTLYAKCTTGNRGNQRLINNCPKYCNEKVFLYPKHLNMIGRYNGLFAYDSVILKHYEILDYYINHGIDRIVLNYL